MWPMRDHPASDLMITVTEIGRAVLAGEADWITLNGIDRWLGGVRLLGTESAWRWKNRSRRLIPLHR